MFRSYTSTMRFGSGTGAILFSDMYCDGTEVSLQTSSCMQYSNPVGCSHSSDVGVWCDSIINDGTGECCKWDLQELSV